MLRELKMLSDKLYISTDDGSIGQKGTVVDALSDFLSRHPSPLTRYLLYACGRKSMLEAVSRIALEQGIKGYVSAEEHMACGVGACLGCAIKTKSVEHRANPPLPPFAKGGRGGITNSTPMYKMVCKDGPVFPVEEIVW